MSTVQLDLEDDLIELLRQSQRPVPQAARELIVLELYRQGTISGGKAAQLLGLSRLEFAQHAARLGIPYFSMTDEEWNQEARRSESLSGFVVGA